ncbi:MAG: hypothetical protein WC788_01685 [Candidatus Paceibacterota bacterium]|jgi:hypothetical protein
MTNYIKDENTGKYEEIVDISSGIKLKDRKIYEEVWSYKKRDYEMHEMTKEEIKEALEFEAEIKDKTCEICGSKATSYTHSGGLKVFHCSQCLWKVGQDEINRRLRTKAHTKEQIQKNNDIEQLIHMAEFVKLAEGKQKITKICSICGEPFQTDDPERDSCSRKSCITTKRHQMMSSRQ